MLLFRPVGYKVSPREAPKADAYQLALASVGSTALGIPESGYFMLYLGSNVPRERDLSYYFRSDVTVVRIDILLGAHHDLASQATQEVLVCAAGSVRCCGVMGSVECRTFSSAHLRPDEDGKARGAYRSLDAVEGIRDANGNLPPVVEQSNKMTMQGVPCLRK